MVDEVETGVLDTVFRCVLPLLEDKIPYSVNCFRFRVCCLSLFTARLGRGNSPVSESSIPALAMSRSPYRSPSCIFRLLQAVTGRTGGGSSVLFGLRS